MGEERLSLKELSIIVYLKERKSAGLCNTVVSGQASTPEYISSHVPHFKGFNVAASFYTNVIMEGISWVYYKLPCEANRDLCFKHPYYYVGAPGYYNIMIHAVVLYSTNGSCKSGY